MTVFTYGASGLHLKREDLFLGREVVIKDRITVNGLYKIIKISESINYPDDPWVTLIQLRYDPPKKGWNYQPQDDFPPGGFGYG